MLQDENHWPEVVVADLIAPIVFTHAHNHNNHSE